MNFNPKQYLYFNYFFLLQKTLQKNGKKSYKIFTFLKKILIFDFFVGSEVYTEETLIKKLFFFLKIDSDENYDLQNVQKQPSQMATYNAQQLISPLLFEENV